MNSIEEKLWNYIDGNCTPEEQQAISLLIEQNEAYRNTYNELLVLNAEMATIELDEPPMAFTYNVLEQIRAEQAHKPLKAAIDKRIITGIAAFFLISIGVLVIYMLTQINWTSDSTGWRIPEIKAPELKAPDLKNVFSGTIVQSILFVDTVLGLFLFDGWLRRRNMPKTA
ncbi:hypothetical protein GCM10023149_44610 [Mucilaginibacter gynuensis]|uniref:Zinc-finger domain-containing protein n=1 Tax=Mucilaginibacter gynuensis TaxID=1302236 RepID=A0ABP8H958_9SPHI